MMYAEILLNQKWKWVILNDGKKSSWLYIGFGYNKLHLSLNSRDEGIEGRTNASINVQLWIYANLFWQSDNLLKPPEPIYSNYLMYSVGKPPARSYQNFLIFSKPIIFPIAAADEKLSTNNQIPMKLSK